MPACPWRLWRTASNAPSAWRSPPVLRFSSAIGATSFARLATESSAPARPVVEPWGPPDASWPRNSWRRFQWCATSLRTGVPRGKFCLGLNQTCFKSIIVAPAFLMNALLPSSRWLQATTCGWREGGGFSKFQFYLKNKVYFLNSL